MRSRRSTAPGEPSRPGASRCRSRRGRRGRVRGYGRRYRCRDIDHRASAAQKPFLRAAAASGTGSGRRRRKSLRTRPMSSRSVTRCSRAPSRSAMACSVRSSRRESAGRPQAAVGFPRQHRFVECGKFGISAVTQMQRRLQWRAINVLLQAHRPQHSLAGSGYLGVEEGCSERDCTAAEPDVHGRGVLGRKADGDDIGSGLNMPGLCVAAGRRPNSGRGDDARNTRQRRV